MAWQPQQSVTLVGTVQTLFTFLCLCLFLLRKTWPALVIMRSCSQSPNCAAISFVPNVVQMKAWSITEANSDTNKRFVSESPQFAKLNRTDVYCLKTMYYAARCVNKPLPLPEYVPLFHVRRWWSLKKVFYCTHCSFQYTCECELVRSNSVVNCCLVQHTSGAWPTSFSSPVQDIYFRTVNYMYTYWKLRGSISLWNRIRHSPGSQRYVRL